MLFRDRYLHCAVYDGYLWIDEDPDALGLDDHLARLRRGSEARPDLTARDPKPDPDLSRVVTALLEGPPDDVECLGGERYRH